MQESLEIVISEADMGFDIGLIALERNFEATTEIRNLKAMIRDLESKKLEIYGLMEACRQASGQYLSIIAQGARVLGDRTAFRQQTSEAVSNMRYTDMAYRIFRNDALQKYHAQFDLAAMYTYLAAKTYGYETNLLHFDQQSGEPLLNRIVRERTIGRILSPPR